MGEWVGRWVIFTSCALHLSYSAEELFAELSEKPLGAASLAQCHRGVLHDGRVVAVKIQHPDVRKNGYTDMSGIDVSLGRGYETLK